MIPGIAQLVIHTASGIFLSARKALPRAITPKLKAVLANPHQQFAALSYVFSFWNPEGHEFEAIFRSILVANACGKVQRFGSQRDLQMHSVAYLKLGAGAYAGASFSQIDSPSIYVGRNFPSADTDSDVLVELKSRKATLGG